LKSKYITYKETRLLRLPIAGGNVPVRDASVSVLHVKNTSQINHT
jgi:hypothetical protein